MDTARVGCTETNIVDLCSWLCVCCPGINGCQRLLNILYGYIFEDEIVHVIVTTYLA